MLLGETATAQVVTAEAQAHIVGKGLSHLIVLMDVQSF